MIVSVVIEVFTATPLTKVAAAIVYVHGHTPRLGTVSGNETVREVFGAKVNGGVVNTNWQDSARAERAN